jgi:ATP-dependent DNA helicase RecQ
MGSVNKYAVLRERARHHTTAGGVLVFCQTKAECERVLNVLAPVADGHHGTVGLYHADLSNREKGQAAELFAKGSIKILVCTVAFGMGVDVGNVSTVLHWGTPGSLEQYVQEIGRAGRTGSHAVCHMFHGGDVYARIASKVAWNDRYRKELLQNASVIQSYCGLAWACRHAFISRAFGDEKVMDCVDCCDVCRG